MEREGGGEEDEGGQESGSSLKRERKSESKKGFVQRSARIRGGSDAG